MTAPVNQFIAIEIDAAGWAVGEPLFFQTRPEAAEGSKDLARKAPSGHSIYIYTVAAHLDVTVTYDLVID